MPTRHGKAGAEAPPDDDSEEQAALLPSGGGASERGGGDGSGGSIYEPKKEKDDACKIIISLIPIVYGPSLLYSMGEAITDPVLLLYATDQLGVSVSAGAFAVSANHYGKLLSNVPAGMLYTWLGPGPSMAFAGVLYAVGTLLAIWLPRMTPASIPAIVPFCLSLMLCGTGNAVWQISRQTYVRTLVPVAVRGRATALMGGTGRVVSVIGPACETPHPSPLCLLS